MTLLELAIVATMAGIMLGMVAPKLVHSYSRLQLDKAVHEIGRDLGRARMDAIRRNQSVTVTRLADTAYRVGAEPHRRLPMGVTFKPAGSLATVTFTGLGILSTAPGNFIVRTSSTSRLVLVWRSGHVSVR
jgi:type II secretory pathway pseudopilin PulG